MMDPRFALQRALQAGIAASGVQIAELRKARRAAKEADARKRRRLEREWVLTVPERRHDLDVALTIFMLGGYAPEPDVVFLRGLGRQYQCETPKAKVELLDIVEYAVLAADLVSLGALCARPRHCGLLRRSVALRRVQGGGRASRHGSDRG